MASHVHTTLTYTAIRTQEQHQQGKCIGCGLLYRKIQKMELSQSSSGQMVGEGYQVEERSPLHARRRVSYAWKGEERRNIGTGGGLQLWRQPTCPEGMWRRSSGPCFRPPWQALPMYSPLFSKPIIIFKR